MKELMIHVERIVRPVRARQSRKLRMRRELLSHLQAAVQHERGKTAEESAAVSQAIKRLGDPNELTRQLQGSVPFMERLLLARTPDRWNGWEKRAAKRIGLYDPATFAHWIILYGSGLMAICVIAMFSPRIAPESRTRVFVAEIDHPVRSRIALITVWIAAWSWVFVGNRFLTVASAPQGQFRPARSIRTGALVLIMQALWMLLVITQIIQRSPTVAEMAQSMGVSLLLLGIVTLVGRGVAALRRPYDEWLTLDLAT